MKIWGDTVIPRGVIMLSKGQKRYITCFPFRVEPYSIHRSYRKLKYLKTEFIEDNACYCEGYIS